jgi:hypothetical protein
MRAWAWAWCVVGAGASIAACSAGAGLDPTTGGEGGSGAGMAMAGPGATSGSGMEGAGGLVNPAGGGTGGLQDGGECAAVSQTATNTYLPVDIIWALDTSDSMVSELQAVEDNMNIFASTILNQGIDVHVVVIAKPGEPDGGDIFNPDPGICIDPPLATGSCPGGSKPPNYQHVEDGVGSNNALNKFISNYPNYKPTLRQKALKYFAVVTDDEAEDGPNNSAAAFTSSVTNLDPGWFDAWKFFGVFCTGGCNVFLACENTGDVYNALVAQTGGVAGDLCGGNSNGFAPVFDALAKSVVDGKQLDCAWAIPPPPMGEQFQKDKVNVSYSPSMGAPQTVYHVTTEADCGPQGGWFYDDNASPTKVNVCPTTCATIQADPQGKIDILFGCATLDVPK